MEAQQLALFDLAEREPETRPIDTMPKVQAALFDAAATLPASPTTWETYRRAGDLGELVKDAVADFYQRRGALPVGVRVHPKNFVKTRAALEGLDLVNLSQRVQTNGGTLACEVELA